MDELLKKHLLEESKAMLAESRSALQRATDQLNKCIAHVEEGDFHPLRKSFQTKTLTVETVKAAIESYQETRKRGFEESELQRIEQPNEAVVEDKEVLVDASEDMGPTDTFESNAAIEKQLVADEERIRQEYERVEKLRIEAELAEQKRFEAERALAEDKARLEQIEQQKAELRRKIEQEQAELQRIAEEREEIERLTREKQLRETERQEAARLAKEEEEARLLQAALLAKAAQEEADRAAERKAAQEREEAERQAAERKLAEEKEETERKLKEEERERRRDTESKFGSISQELESEKVVGSEETEVEDEAERALREALAEKTMLEESMYQDDHSEDMAVEEGELEEEQENRKVEASAAETSPEKSERSFSDKKYVTIQDVMLQPARTRFLQRTLKTRVLVLREDKFRFFDETQTKLLGGLSLAEEGVEVVLTALKKSPSGLSLRFNSPRCGTLEFYPANEEMGKKWIAAIEHNMEMRYELPDLGPEDAPTYYDYLGVHPEHADSSTLLQAYADKTRGAGDEWLRAKLNEALQILNDPFKRVEYDNYVMVQRKYRFGAVSTVQIKTPRGEATDAVMSRVFTDASFSHLYWQDIRLGASLTGRHLCVELVRIHEVLPGSTSNAVNLLLNNEEVLIFIFKEKREAEDFGAAIRFAKTPQLNSARRRQSVMETSV